MSYKLIIPNCSCCGCIYTLYASGTTPYASNVLAQARFDDRTRGCVLSAGGVGGDTSRNYLTANLAANVLTITDSITAASAGSISYEEDFEVTMTTSGVSLACALTSASSMDLTVDALLAYPDDSYTGVSDALTPTTGTLLSGTLNLVPPVAGVYIVKVSMGVTTMGPPPAGLVTTANVVASSSGALTYCPIQVAYVGGNITCELP